jgi:hypothetical protein
MALIRSLKANVSEEEAIAQFSAPGAWNRLSEARFGPLRSVARFYIPFRLFQVEIRNGGRLACSILGVDAVTGSLNPYGFPSLPSDDEIVVLETRNCPPPRLEPAQAGQLLITKVERLLFTSGFFRLRDLRIRAMPVAGEIHIPYWVGFRGAGQRARWVVLDAVRRKKEGAKVGHLLASWLSSVQAEKLGVDSAGKPGSRRLG